MKKHNREGKKRRKREKEHLKRAKVGKEQQQQHPLELLVGCGQTPIEALEDLHVDTENLLIESTKTRTGIVLRRASEDGGDV